MLADINLLCIIKAIFHDSILILWINQDIRCSLGFLTGNGFKYFFQSASPCFISFFKSDLGIAIRESAICCNLTDQCILYRQLPNLAIRNLKDNITKSWCKEVSWIQIVLDLNTHSITKCHLAHCSYNSVTVKRICRNNFTIQNILM